MKRDICCEESKKNWSKYYKSILEETSNKYFLKELKKYTYTHTWENSIRVILKYTAIKNGDKVLDAGSGWGRMILGLLEYVNGANFYAVDVQEDAIKKAKTLIGNEKSGNTINWQVSNILSLPFKDNEFDVVFSARVFQHLHNPKIAIQEVIRVLKPGGRFLIFLQNRLNPLNINYYLRLYSPSELGNWFKRNTLRELHVRSMDFFPFFLNIPLSESMKQKFESVCEDIPILNKFGGKSLAWGAK